jgi:hypothetical protein
MAGLVPAMMILGEGGRFMKTCGVRSTFEQALTPALSRKRERE